MKQLAGKFKNKTFRRIFISVLLVLIIAIGYLYYQKAHGRIAIDDSLVSAPIITVSSPTGSKLLETHVYEGQEVKKGDTLAILDSGPIISQTDGLIIMEDNAIGSAISNQTQLVQLIQPQDLRIDGTIDENKGLKDIRIGQVMSFTIDALPGQTFWGYVDEVSPTAKTTQVAFSISSERPTQQFQVYARFNASAYPQIKNGMSAKMVIFTETN